MSIPSIDDVSVGTTVRAVLISLALAHPTLVACSPSHVGEPCTPADEYTVGSLGADPGVLTIDSKSFDCDTRVCMTQYFRGRVTCPYGNSMVGAVEGVLPPGPCLEVPGFRGYFTDSGATTGNLCCPVAGVDPTFAGDPGQTPALPPGNKILQNVSAQCAARPASEAVYCTCRCDIPSVDATDPDNPIPIDKSLYNLCTCPSGFQCVAMCDGSHGLCKSEPFGLWGSYCVKDAEVAYDNPDTVTGICSDDAAGLAPPAN